MVIEIDETMRQMAAWAERQCDALYAGSKRGNYTKLSAERRWYHGFLGELVFLKYLQHHYVRYRYEPDFTGRDDTDFYLWAEGYGKVGIDVKTASKPDHRYLMLPDAQLASHPSGVYVGVRINSPDQGEVLGYALRKHLRPITDVQLPVPTSGVLFEDLRPISKMLEQAKKLMG